MFLNPLRSNEQRKAVVTPATVSAPVKGWDNSSALAAMDKLSAVQLKNWFPQPGYIEVRKGYRQHARNIVSTTTSIQSLMAWNGPSSSKMFAAGGGAIYDTTASGAVGSAELSGFSENRWQYVNMTTSAGAFLFIVNGTDTPYHYNGSVWTAPSITGTTPSDFIQVNVHKKRLWFVPINSTKAWYLATEAVAGAATGFELGSHFDLGGYLVAMATWTVDGGSGPDDMAVFISSKGQVAIYQGTDPASANTWALIGVFNLPAPIGRRCFVKYGTAPLLITVTGVLQLTFALKEDKANVSGVTLTSRILNAMNTAAGSYKDNFGWELCVYPQGTRLILNIPTAENSTAIQYVMNTITGAWCEFDNHNANCWIVFNEELYFGANEGKVYLADQGSADIADPITAIGQCAYQSFASPGSLKRFSMMQPLVTTVGSARPAVGISVDFRETSSLSTPSGATESSSVWDQARWDQAVWGGGTVFINDWTSTPALGRFASVKFRAITGTGATASAWGTSRWGTAMWGVVNASDQTMQINGFVLLAEVGGYV
jgi:hypothetical protein